MNKISVTPRHTGATSAANVSKSMSNRAKTSIYLAVLVACLLAPFSMSFAQDDALQAVVEELQGDPNNPILLMQQQMLAYKLGQADRQAVGWQRWRPRTNLRRELTGAIWANDRRGSLAGSVSLLTGQRAIDESLQLGSIGVNRATDDGGEVVSIDDIEYVEIASHPWEEMIAGEAIAVPDIAQVVPKDMLFVHMIDPQKFLEFEDIVQQQADLFGDVYNLGSATELKPKMMRRLGIPDADALIVAVEEMAFVSDDLSFMPRTDYALILKMVNELAATSLELIVGDSSIHRKVGDYVVIATHEDIIGRIERAHGQSGAMASALDYHYALLKMEARRDGLIYLSEAFIRKLTGPAYRINARRRNTILDALETLQYSVFAYRRITGRWPTSLDEMIDAKYIDGDAIFAPENYSIDSDGRVSHRTWGSVWQVTPVNQVSLDNVTKAEKTNYERFSAGYQSFFREFFDPISVAYTISDQLYLHTLILPLIDNSQYRELQSFFGGEQRALSFLFDADRLGAINIAAGFSIDDLLIRFGGRGIAPGEVDLESDDLREQLIYRAESRMSQEVLGEPLAEGERLLDFLGDEIMFGVGEKNSFSMSNIADLDIWFGVKLNDRERAQAFFRKLWKRIADEVGSRGMFGLSSTEPLSNEYNGQQFYLLPAGFVNIMYVFFDDAFYVTVSQVAMNRLIDAHNTGKADAFSENLERSFSHIGTRHNLVAAMDLEKTSSFVLGQEVNLWGQRVSTQFDAHRDMLEEAMTLAKILPDYDGTLHNVVTYNRALPVDFYGAEFVADAGALYLETADERVAIAGISSSRNNSELSRVLNATISSDDLRARVRSFRAAALGMSFLPEGLEVKLTLGNPNVNTADERFSFDEPERPTPASQNRMLWLVAGLVALGVLILMLRRRKG